MLLIITLSGPVHCTSNSESPTARVTVHVKENISPVVGLPGGEIVALGGGTEGWNEQQVKIV